MQVYKVLEKQLKFRLKKMISRIHTTYDRIHLKTVKTGPAGGKMNHHKKTHGRKLWAMRNVCTHILDVAQKWEEVHENAKRKQWIIAFRSGLIQIINLVSQVKKANPINHECIFNSIAQFQ